MASARFVLENHYAKLQIWIARGVSLANARVLLRRAAREHRTLVREDPTAFAAYLIAQLVKHREARQHVHIDTAKRTRPAELVFRIETTKRGPMLHITEDSKIKYSGPFYKWAGPMVLVVRSGRGRKSERKRRLQKYNDDYFKAHGRYPDEPNTSRFNNVYTPMQKRLREQQEAYDARSNAASAAHRRRKKRKQLLTEKGATPPKKFEIKEHYSPVPESIDPEKIAGKRTD